MSDREMLQQLADFLNRRTFIQGDEDSIRDMVTRYANPPLTLHNRVSMRMTVTELNQLNALMKKVNEHLGPVNVGTELPSEWVDEATAHMKEHGSFGLAEVIDNQLAERTTEDDTPLEQIADDH